MARELSKVLYLTSGSVMARPVALLADIVHALSPALSRQTGQSRIICVYEYRKGIVVEEESRP